jgi:hypothetical protein
VSGLSVTFQNNRLARDSNPRVEFAPDADLSQGSSPSINLVSNGCKEVDASQETHRPSVVPATIISVLVFVTSALRPSGFTASVCNSGSCVAVFQLISPVQSCFTV